MQIAGVALTMAFLWLMWSVRGKLTSHGFEYVNWLPTAATELVWAVTLGTAGGALTAWWFQGYDKSHSPVFADVWMAITIGPLVEEIIFRGYLFWATDRLLNRWFCRPDWPVGLIVACLFALSHMAKPGITAMQIASILVTGMLYSWLRLKSGSTVPPVCAHMSFNAVIYLAAVFL